MPKYFPARLQPLQTLCDGTGILRSGVAPSAAGPLASALEGFINAAITKSSWQKYTSGWRAFLAFQEYTGAVYPLPLAAQDWRAFTTWCLAVRHLQPSSTRAYISAIIFVHHLAGHACIQAHKDPVVNLVLRGASNLRFLLPAKPMVRRVVTFSMLRVIGHRIAGTSWNAVSKQVVWACCCVAFFTSARIGELLADSGVAHDPTANLLWKDIIFVRDQSAILHLKANKSVHPEGEFLDVFTFPGFGCCPLKALTRLKAVQEDAGIACSDEPVFRFAARNNLTHSTLNALLAQLLQDICKPGENTISCHSFRAGIPTTLSLFPDLCNSDDVKGWGRWASDCYTRYTRLRHDQRQAIFGKIAHALKSSS